jgi:hypothetical protein
MTRVSHPCSGQEAGFQAGTPIALLALTWIIGGSYSSCRMPGWTLGGCLIGSDVPDLTCMGDWEVVDAVRPGWHAYEPQL